MRKQYSVPLVSIALILTLIIGLYGCSNEDENSNQNDVSQFTFRVTDGGYSDHDATGSRAIEENYTTTFTAGDCIGLFSVKNNTIIDSNIPLTLGEDGKIWTGKTYYEGTDVQYYAYYPYQTALNTGALDLSAVNDDVKFFTSVIQGWTPSKDQSDYATGYTSSDLMTGVSSPSTNPDGTHNLNITLTHRMAMVVINLPGKYHLSTDVNYTWTITVPNETGFTDFTPYSINPNSYRYLVKPATETTLLGSYKYAGDGKSDYEITANIPSSRYKNYNIDGVSIPYVLQAGDYYLNDGSIVGKNVVLTKTQQTACIGIVFYAGKHSTDASNYSKPLFSGAACIGSNNIHGYAVALTDVGRFIWEPSLPDNSPYGNKLGTSITETDWSGYGNQTAFHTYFNQVRPPLKMEDYIALNQSEKYGIATESIGYAVPPKCSGWFLPSAGQLKYLSDQKSSLSVQIGNLGIALDNANIKWFMEAEYWSSSEHTTPKGAYLVNFKLSPTALSGKWRNNSLNVRAVCAF